MINWPRRWNWSWLTEGRLQGKGGSLARPVNKVFIGKGPGDGDPYHLTAADVGGLGGPEDGRNKLSHQVTSVADDLYP
jgi:hypothetical protein